MVIPIHAKFILSLEKSPILECVHKEVEQCHYTYVTQFKPSQEEVPSYSYKHSAKIEPTDLSKVDTDCDKTSYSNVDSNFGSTFD